MTPIIAAISTNPLRTKSQILGAVKTLRYPIILGIGLALARPCLDKLRNLTWAQCKQKITQVREFVDRKVHRHPYIAMTVAALLVLTTRELRTIIQTNAAQKRSQFVDCFDQIKQARSFNTQEHVKEYLRNQALQAKMDHDNVLLNQVIGIEHFDVISKVIAQILQPILSRLDTLSRHYLNNHYANSKIDPTRKLRSIT